MKTIEEWIEICKKTQPEIGREWEHNMLTLKSCESKILYGSMGDALFEADEGNFIWSNSLQGHRYWLDIRNDMMSNPNKYMTPKRKLFNTI